MDVNDFLSSSLLSAQYWAYRFGGYVLTNVMDDPAWLALMFC